MNDANSRSTPRRIHTHIIEPSGRWVFPDLYAPWRYRELLYFLIWRDVKVRYKQTVLGALWVVLQPLLLMTVFSVILGSYAKLPSDGVPYPIFTFSALLPWMLFANALSSASMSLVDSQHLITKTYFPRILLPLAASLVPVVDFAVSSLILIVLMSVYGVALKPALLALPFLVLITVFLSLSISLWVSALNVRFRDFRYIVPFCIQLFFYVTPVVYSATIVPEQWRLLYGMNPMTQVLEGFRWAVLGHAPPLGVDLALSSIIVVVIFLGGLLYFSKTERTFADVI